MSLRAARILAAIAVSISSIGAYLLIVSSSRDADFESENRPWLSRIRTFPAGAPPVEARLEAFSRWQQLRSPRAASGAPQWTSIGPLSESGVSNCFSGLCSGRVTAIAVHPTDPDTVYIGGAAGGVWKITRGQTAWTPLTDFEASLSIGALAIDPSNPETIYAGTGEQNDASHEYPGVGILKSANGGASWTLLASGVFGNQTIGALAVSRSKPNVVLAAARFGIYQSQDGGVTWRRTLPTDIAADAVFFDPADPATVYASVGGTAASAYSGVYASTDSGGTWQARNGSGNSLPVAQAGRIALAISAGPTRILYAGISALNGDSLALYKSDNTGATWTELPGPSYCPSYFTTETAQCNYGNVIAVDPANPSLLLAGGIYLLASADAGNTWPSDAAHRQPVHVDQHAIAFSADGSRVYVGNDGGVWSATVNGTGFNWQSLNATLNLAQFYPGVSTDPNNLNVAYGGTQDNNVLLYSGQQEWKSVSGGDGAATAIDGSNVYITLAGGSALANPVWKSTGGGAFQSASNGIDSGKKPFPPYLALDPQNPMTLYYTGLSQLYQSTDGAGHWNAIPAGSDSPFPNLCTIAVAPRDSKSVYAGACTGQVWTTQNATDGANSVWTDVTQGLPLRAVTHITVGDPATLAYVTLSGSFAGHIYKTVDRGRAWMNLTGHLPDISVNDLVLDPDILNTMYVATDLGVYWTNTAGQAWSVLGDGLPNSPVVSLQLHRATPRTLRAATHGRGAWDLVVPVNASPIPLLTSATISGTTLTIDGQNFNSGSVAYWNDASRPTTFLSATRLTAVLFNADSTSDALVQITVFTPGPGGGTSEVQFVKIGPAPAIYPGGILNAAGFGVGYGVAPGSIAAAFGTKLAVAAAVASGDRLPLALGSPATSLTILDSNNTLPFSGRLFYADAQQVNFQVPWSIRPGDSAVLRPIVGGSQGPAVTAHILPFAPGIFTMDAAGQGAVTSVAGQLASAGGSPVARGDLITIWCTGLGAVTNQPGDGSPAAANPLSLTVITPVVLVGGVTAGEVLFSGLAPGLVGVDQINVRVPVNAPVGNAVALMVTDGKGTYSNTVFIAIR
jgi:uncharacterized protein (TIGR03437 family)